MSQALILKPRLSEKSYGLSESHNTYVFDIPAGANRHDVLRAVKAQYSVDVVRVRVAKAAAKAKRTYRRGGRVSHKGQRSPIRKAYVTIAEGATLPLFAEVKEAEEKAAKEKK